MVPIVMNVSKGRSINGGLINIIPVANNLETSDITVIMTCGLKIIINLVLLNIHLVLFVKYVVLDKNYLVVIMSNMVIVKKISTTSLYWIARRIRQSTLSI